MADGMTHGVVKPSCTTAKGRLAGGVGRHCPGAIPPVFGGGAGGLPAPGGCAGSVSGVNSRAKTAVADQAARVVVRMAAVTSRSGL